MHIEDIEYSFDGRRMVGRLAVDESRPGPRPGVLVCHPGSGLDEQSKDRAERLASLGYVAFAIDYLGDGRNYGTLLAPDADPGSGEREMVTRALDSYRSDRTRMRAVAQAGLDVLLAQPNVDVSRVAAIGYCFGGTMVVEMARGGVDVKAVVGYHPAFPEPVPEETRTITAKVLLCTGSDDPYAPAASRHAFEADLVAAGVAGWRIELYGGVGHSFTDVNSTNRYPGVGYDEAADRCSWRSTLDLLEETIGTR
jgi:dienelactone hydrolase